jgi:hypothetical protein
MERDGQPLALRRPVDGVGERVDFRRPALGLRVELEAVLAHGDDAVDSDQPPDLVRGSAADTGDEGVAGCELPEHGARRFRYIGVLGAVDDGSEGPVHVEQERCLARPLGETDERIPCVHHCRENTAVVANLVLIGLAAGLFSALFGVGGGIVVVPLLLLLERWQQRPAMATSLAAIGIIALAGTISYAIRGEVKPGAAAIVGLPAAVGAIAGTALQQRLANRTLSLLFALLLLGIGVKLLL